MSAFTSKATGQWEAEGQSTWNEVGHPQAGDDVTIQNTHVVTQVQNEACAGLVIDAGGRLNMATFNLANSALTDVSGILSIGTSAATGLTTVGLTWNSGCTAIFSADSKIYNSSNYTAPDETFFSSDIRGEYYQTGNGNYLNPKGRLNSFAGFEIQAGFTLTVTGNSDFADGAANWFRLYGILALGIFDHSMGVKYNGEVDFGVNCDMTGSGDINWSFPSATTSYTMSKTGTFSFSGTMITDSSRGAWGILSGDWRNATFQHNSTSGDRNVVGMAGTIILKSLILNITHSVGSLAFNNNTNNPNYIFYDAVNLRSGAGTQTVTYNVGTGNITYAGSSGTHQIELDGHGVEAIAIDCSGATKNFTENFTTVSLTMTAGIAQLPNGQTVTMTDFAGSGGSLQSNSAGNQATIALTNTAATGVSGVTFKDIAMNAAQKINAKDSCVNSGNTKGIVFQDGFGEM